MGSNVSQKWVKLINADEVKEGDVERCDVRDLCIAVFNVMGEFYATSDICTHAHAHLSEGYVQGETIECPLHQGLFHIPSGRAIGSPATEDLRVFNTRVEGGYVYAELGGTESNS